MIDVHALYSMSLYDIPAKDRSTWSTCMHAWHICMYTRRILLR